MLIKSIAGLLAIAAVATTAAKVKFDAQGLTVGGKTVTESTLQLHDAGTGTVLASSKVVESLGGEIEVGVDGDRVIDIEPGVRVTKVESGYEMSTHGKRQLWLQTDKGGLLMASPVIVAPVEGGWTVGEEKLDGDSLAVSVSQEIATDPVVVADNGTPPPAPAPVKGRRPRVRRLLNTDPTPGSQASDENATKQISDVSPIGRK